MAARFQSWFEKNIWSLKSSSNMSISGEFWSHVYGEMNFGDEPVSERLAHRIATVFTCLNVRSRTISSLPINVMREKNGRKEVLEDHPAYYLLAHEPNNYMTSANMFLSSMIHSDSWGNSFIHINRSFSGDIVSLDLLCPWDVTIGKHEGQAFYYYDGQNIRAKDMLHFRWFSYDGLNGVSPIRMNADTFGAARKQDKYSTMTIGKRPPGILSYDGNQSPTQKAQNQKSWEDDMAAGRVPLLTGNWKYQPIILPPADAEIINTKKLTKLDILGIFQMPPTFVQDYERATFTNAEQSDLIYAKHTITPIVRMIEQECNMKLFSDREKKHHFTKFNLNGLLRGDSKARAEFYTAMRNIGGYNANEIRSKEDENEYAGGDIYTVQGAMVPVDMLREFYSNKLMPTVPKPSKENVNGYEYN